MFCSIGPNVSSKKKVLAVQSLITNVISGGLSLKFSGTKIAPILETAKKISRKGVEL